LILGDVCSPGVAFRRFNYTPGLGPDDPVVFNIVLCRVLFHLFEGLVPGFNGCFAVFVAPDGIMFFDIWFAFWDSIICYVDDNIRKLLNRILCTADSVSAAPQNLTYSRHEAGGGNDWWNRSHPACGTFIYSWHTSRQT